MKTYCPLLLAAALAGCATSPKIVAGRYVETPEAGILWVGHSLTLQADHTFTYSRWSDDMASNEYGAGSYQVRAKELRLAFEKQLPSSSKARVEGREYQPDTVVTTFQVSAKASGKSGLEPVPYATVVALGPTNETIAANPTNESGQATLRLARAAQPQSIRIAYLGFLTLNQPYPTSNTAYQVLLEANPGTPVAAGTIRTYPILRVADKQLIIVWDKRKTVFTRQLH